MSEPPKARGLRLVPPPAPVAASAPPFGQGEQLLMFGAEEQLLPCGIEVEFNYATLSATVRRQSDEGGKVVLAVVGGGVLQPLKRWRTHTDPDERRAILTRIERTIGKVKVL